MNFLIISLKRESPGGTTPGDSLLSDERMDILISFSCQYIYHAEYGFSRLLRNFLFLYLSIYVKPLTDAQIATLQALDTRSDEPDTDCPKLTEAQLSQFQKAHHFQAEHRQLHHN